MRPSAAARSSASSRSVRPNRCCATSSRLILRPAVGYPRTCSSRWASSGFMAEIAASEYPSSRSASCCRRVMRSDTDRPRATGWRRGVVRALAQVGHQVGRDHRPAELPDHRRDLPAVIRRVVHHVLQLLPEGLHRPRAPHVGVFERLRQRLVGLVRQEGLPRAHHLAPPLAQIAQCRHRVPRRRRRWRAALPAFHPDPVGGSDVSERIAHGREAAAEIAAELFRGQRGGRVEHARVGPGRIVEQHPHVRRIHQGPPRAAFLHAAVSLAEVGP